MAYLDLGPRVEVMTPKKAKHFLKYNKLKFQRGISKNWVATLAKKIQEGKALPFNIDIALLKEEKYLVNGQHSCKACILTDAPIKAIVTEYLCETWDDVVVLFRQMDDTRRRKPSMYTNIELDRLGYNWLKSTPIKLTACMRILKGNKIVSRSIEMAQGNDSFWERIIYWKREGDFLNDIFVKDARPFLMHRFILAAAILTERANHKKAVTFWTKVKTGENLTAGDPAFVLRDYLQRDFTYRQMKNKQRDLELIVSKKCIIAWNNFIKGVNDLKLLNTTGEGVFPRVLIRPGKSLPKHF